MRGYIELATGPEAISIRIARFPCNPND